MTKFSKETVEAIKIMTNFYALMYKSSQEHTDLVLKGEALSDEAVSLEDTIQGLAELAVMWAKRAGLDPEEVIVLADYIAKNRNNKGEAA